MQGVCVYLVGAGPGDPGLLTCKAKRLVEQADCIIYDYLANPEIIGYAQPQAELVYVGKKGFEQHVTQDQINDVLVAKARELAASSTGENKVLVRLKGGDPFVFGRGGEEALALVKSGVPFQVVPGVTSGVAAPACAGIPVTHRGISTNVTFVTGNEDPTKNESTVAWNHLAGLVKTGGTVCFYMGMRNLELICSSLAAQGVGASTPVAVVEWGATPRQRSVCAQLCDAPEVVSTAGLGAPAMIVVGQVASLSGELDWRARLPLAGRRVLVTRASHQAGELSSRLEARGAQVIEVPLIAFTDPDDMEPITQAVRTIGDYSWIVFTSANGVERFFHLLERLEAKPCDARILSAALVAAIGPGTARALSAHGIHADVMPRAFVAEEVFAALVDAGLQHGQKVLIPRAQEARDVLVELLEQFGATAQVAPVYKTIMPPEAPQQLAQACEQGLDGIVFTSSSTARNLDVALSGIAVDKPGADVRASVQAFSIGPVTTAALTEQGWDNVVQAHEYTIPGVVAAIEHWFEQEGTN